MYAAAIAKNQGLLSGKTVYVTGTIAEEDCDGEGLKHALQENHAQRLPPYGRDDQYVMILVEADYSVSPKMKLKSDPGSQL